MTPVCLSPACRRRDSGWHSVAWTIAVRSQRIRRSRPRRTPVFPGVPRALQCVGLFRGCLFGWCQPRSSKPATADAEGPEETGFPTRPAPLLVVCLSPGPPPLSAGAFVPVLGPSPAAVLVPLRPAAVLVELARFCLAFSGLAAAVPLSQPSACGGGRGRRTHPQLIPARRAGWGRK